MQPRYKLTIVILLLYIYPGISLWAELQTIFLRNGQILRGEVLKQTATSMQIKIEDGTIRQLDKKDIRRVSYKEPTAQEKKEAAEKAKQEPLPAAPIIPEPTPITADLNQPTSPFDINQNKRNDLEVFIGAGLGKYQPATEDFSNRAGAQASLLFSGSPIAVDQPVHKSGLANSIALTYYWKKFAFGLSGNHFQGETSERMKAYNSATSFQDISGTFPEKQSALKADISFLAYTNARLDLRPALGYSQFWGKTDDNSTLSTGSDLAGINSLFKYHYTFLENLKGPSLGLKTVFRIGERWENRMEFHYLTLTGQQHGSAVLTFLNYNVAPGFASLAQEIDWKAKGFNFVYKLVYRYTPTLSFWIGIQAFEWKYSLNSIIQDVKNPDDAAFPVPVDQVLLQNFLIEATSKSTPASSKSSSLEFGIAKRFEFNR